MDNQHAQTALRIAREWLAHIEAIEPDDTNAQRHAAMDRFAVRDRLFAIQLNLPDPVFSFAIAAVHDAIGWLNHEQRTPEEWLRGVGLIANEVAILADLIGDEPAAAAGDGVEDVPVWMSPTMIADLVGECVKARTLSNKCGRGELRGRQGHGNRWEVDARHVLEVYGAKHPEMDDLAKRVSEIVSERAIVATTAR